jgi:hypothetical protein
VRVRRDLLAPGGRLQGQDQLVVAARQIKFEEGTAARLGGDDLL